eukprot:scaffold280797_cov156-Cyclotella_meneghiniana.AAC.1
MPLDITKSPNKRPISSGHCKSLRSQDKSIADRVKHRKLLAKQSIASKKTGLETTAGYGKRAEEVKRKSVKATSEEEEDYSESEYASREETVTTEGRGFYITDRPDGRSGYYPAIFVPRDSDCPTLYRLTDRDAALRNLRDLVWVRDPTVPTYKDDGKQQ